MAIPSPDHDGFRESFANCEKIINKTFANDIVKRVGIACTAQEGIPPYSGEPFILCKWHAYLVLADGTKVGIVMNKRNGAPGGEAPGVLSFMQPGYGDVPYFFYEANVNLKIDRGTAKASTFRDVLRSIINEGMALYTFLASPETHPAYWYYELLLRLTKEQLIGPDSARGLLRKVDDENAKVAQKWKSDTPAKQFDAEIATRRGRFEEVLDFTKQYQVYV